MAYQNIGQLYPQHLRLAVDDLLQTSGSRVGAQSFLGLLTVWSLAIGFALGILLNVLGQSFLPFFILGVIGVPLLVFANLILDRDRKARFVEQVLPDALALMGSNLRAGYTVDRALLMSARPEFGLFKEELERVGRQIASGKPIGVALTSMTKRITSKKLTRVIELVVSGLRSGGELASLLHQSATDLRNQAIVERKIRTNVNSYVIFIFVAVGVAAPLLFGLSSFLADVIRDILANLELPETGAIPFALGGVTLTTEFVIQFIITFLVVNSILASFVIGLIGQGKALYGLKYMLPLLVLSVSLFLVIRVVIGNLLGAVLTF